MAYYGIPYMGSKDKICDEIIKLFPKANHFYDLFGGGFSITHAMLLRRSKDYKHFHFNEIRLGVTELIKDAIAGKYSYENFKPPFVSREEFSRKLDTCAYTKIIWSFGNNGKTYLFSKEIEPYKRSMHKAIVFNEFDELATRTLGMPKFKDGYDIKARRLYLRNRIEFFRLTKIPEFLHRFLNETQLERLERLQQLQQLQQLQRLQQLQQLQRLLQLLQLEFYNLSYNQVPIHKNSVIYCDPPYKGTAEYDGSFDHEAFYKWCDNLNTPVFISEYSMDKRFKPIFEIKKKSMLVSGAGRKDKMEKVFVNKYGLEQLKKGELINGQTTT